MTVVILYFGYIVLTNWLISILSHCFGRATPVISLLSCMSNQSIYSFPRLDHALIQSDYITLAHPHFHFTPAFSFFFGWSCFLIGTSLLFLFTSVSTSPLFWLRHFTVSPCNWNRLERQSTAEHISPSPLPPALNQGPPILTLTLSASVPHSLSPPSFSLTVSPIALSTESSTADAFSPTCLYLQKKARREHFTSVPLFSPGFPHHSTLLLPLFGTALVALWFSLWNTNDYSSSLFATSCPAPFLLAAFYQKIAYCSVTHCGIVTLVDGWIFQLLTGALFWKKRIHTSSGRAVSSAVIAAGIRTDKLTPGELAEVLQSTVKSPILILSIISTASLFVDGNR